MVAGGHDDSMVCPGANVPPPPPSRRWHPLVCPAYTDPLGYSSCSRLYRRRFRRSFCQNGLRVLLQMESLKLPMSTLVGLTLQLPNKPRLRMLNYYGLENAATKKRKDAFVETHQCDISHLGLQKARHVDCRP